VTTETRRDIRDSGDNRDSGDIRVRGDKRDSRDIRDSGTNRDRGRPQGIMFQIFIIILFRISSKLYHYGHYYSQNLLIILIFPNFTGILLQIFFTFAIKMCNNAL